MAFENSKFPIVVQYKPPTAAAARTYSGLVLAVITKFLNIVKTLGTLREKRLRNTLTTSRSWFCKDAGAEYHIEAALFGEGHTARDLWSKYSCISSEYF